jgi:hypothetical protein
LWIEQTPQTEQTSSPTALQLFAVIYSKGKSLLWLFISIDLIKAVEELGTI